jgi:hypothetical protein
MHALRSRRRDGRHRRPRSRDLTTFQPFVTLIQLAVSVLHLFRGT